MQSALLPPLAIWQNFYVIIGSAAATLTGLMFIVVTLTATLHMAKSNETFAAFGTPNVAHFCIALLIAAALSAPWPVLWTASLLPGLCGLGGATYIIIVLRRVRHQTSYQPVLEDWVWHTACPLVAYVALLVAAITLPGYPALALFIIGAALVLLLFIGIHNAWDTVTFLALERSQLQNEGREE